MNGLDFRRLGRASVIRKIQEIDCIVVSLLLTYLP